MLRVLIPPLTPPNLGGEFIIYPSPSRGGWVGYYIFCLLNNVIDNIEYNQKGFIIKENIPLLNTN